jgi:SynChlorMet cassette radical SAM/SPASM protein ScmE
MPVADPLAVMRSPRSLDLELTARCNLRCRYCYFFSNPAVVYRDLPTAEWVNFFDELGRLGVMEVTLTGGEAFTRPDLHALIEGVVRNRMRFQVLSNGALIDDDLAAFIAETGRCAGVQISLDGARAEMHDPARGTGAFEGAVRGLRTLQRHGLNAQVRLTVHHYNVHDLAEAATFILDELGLPAFSTNAAGYLGNCQRHADEMLLTTAERQEAMATLAQLARRYPGRIGAAAGPLAESVLWHRMSAAEAQHAPAFANGGRLTGCGCTFSKLAVRSDGIIIPCSLLPHLELGHINRDSLAEVWQNHPVLNDLRARRSIPLADFEFCTSCTYQPYCTGNCPGLAYTLTGQVNHPSPDACLRRFLADGGRYRDDAFSA